MLRRAKKSGQPPAAGSPEGSPGLPGEEWEEVDRFLEEMGSLAGDKSLTMDESLTRDKAVPVGAAAAVSPEPPPEKDLQAQWIAEGLGRAAEELERVVAGPQAGPDRGQVFYEAVVEGVHLLVRQDGVRAYVRGSAAARDPRALRVLQGCGLVQVNPPLPARKGEPGQWELVAEGKAPVQGQAARLAFFHPGQPDKPLSFEALSLLSLELSQLFAAGGFDQGSLPNLRALAVIPGQLLGRVEGHVPGQAGQDVFGRVLPPALDSPQGRMEPGEGVELREAGEYRTSAYGYLCLARGRLAVLPPLWLDAGAMHAYWVILDEAAHPVSAEVLLQCLQSQGVVRGILEEKVAELVAQVQAGRHRYGPHLIAQGQHPVDGRDGKVEFLVDLRRRAGREKPDGSMDFREVNFAPNAGPGQVIARRTPPKPGEAGWDVKGRVLPARDGRDAPLRAGGNVEVGLEEEVEIFSAGIEGMVKRRGDEISVVRQLVHRGDVNFDTGNLDFKGEIHIGGSVVHGFSVKASGDITIAGTVEEGGAVISLGDVIVGQGILGRRTQVKAQGSVRAQFVQEARVRAGKDIVLGNYAYHASLHAGGRISVMKGTGNRGGGVLGGELWGLDGIEVHLAGSPNWTLCILVAGLQPEQAQQLDKLRTNLGRCHEHLLKSLRKFNLSRVDLVQIRNMIAAAGGPQRKALMHHARQLGKLVQLYQKLQGEQSELESRISSSVKGASIRVFETAHGGVVIRIGEYQRKLAEDVKSPNFHIHKHKLVER